MKQLLADLSDLQFVSTNDVLRLRREVFGDQLVDRHEAAQLFQLADQAPEGDREWRQFLSEAVTDFFVRQKNPPFYMDEADVDFLIGCIGAPETASDLKVDALCHMLNHAKSAPQKLIDFGFEIVRAHVLADGRVDNREVERLRCFLFAVGSEGNVAVTRAEAELLFDINDLTKAEENDPAWGTFFAQAVASHLMAHIGYEPLSRTEALRLQESFSEKPDGVGGFMSNMVSGGIAAIINAYKKDTAYADKNRAREAEAASAEEVNASEADWLADRIGRDGLFNEAEKAVITHLKSLRGQLPPKLETLAARD